MVYEYPDAISGLEERMQPYGFETSCRGILVNLKNVAKAKGYEVILPPCIVFQVYQCHDHHGGRGGNPVNPWIYKGFLITVTHELEHQPGND